MSQQELQNQISKLWTHVAVASDQARRAENDVADLEAKLEDRLERLEQRLESKIDNVGNRVHELANVITKLEAEQKSNTKWVGWGIAGLIAAGDIVFNLLTMS